MLAEKSTLASHAGEDQALPEFATRLAHHEKTMEGIRAARLEAVTDSVIAQAWSTKLPVIDNAPLTAVILRQSRKPAVGDVVYVTEVRRHVVTNADLNAAARAVIGGVA